MKKIPEQEPLTFEEQMMLRRIARSENANATERDGLIYLAQQQWRRETWKDGKGRRSELLVSVDTLLPEAVENHLRPVSEASRKEIGLTTVVDGQNGGTKLRLDGDVAERFFFNRRLRLNVRENMDQSEIEERKAASARIKRTDKPPERG